MATIKNYFVGIETESRGCVSSVVKSTLDLKDFGDLIKGALISYCEEREDTLLDLYLYEEEEGNAKNGRLVYNLDGVFYG